MTINSPKYAKLDQLQIPNYYYETMKINIVQNGYYNLVSNSSINLDGTVYQNNINLTDAFENRINGVNNNHCNKQFNINVYLKTNTTYMLLVTTSEENITGPFSIVMSGIDMITLEKIGELLYFYFLIINYLTCIFFCLKSYQHLFIQCIHRN